MPVPHTADRALSWGLRLLLAGCALATLCGTLCGLKIYADVVNVGYSETCLPDGLTCLWVSDGMFSLTYPPASPCWRTYDRPC